MATRSMQVTATVATVCVTAALKGAAGVRQAFDGHKRGKDLYGATSKGAIYVSCI